MCKFIHPRWTRPLRPMGWGRVVLLTSSSLRHVPGGLLRCLMATRSSQKKARSPSELLKASGEYLMQTPSPASTYMCVSLPDNETLIGAALQFFLKSYCFAYLFACLGSFQSRVPRWGNRSTGPERARSCSDWWRWNSRRSKGHQGTVYCVWTLGPQRADHYHQHMVLWAFQTGECWPATHSANTHTHQVKRHGWHAVGGKYRYMCLTAFIFSSEEHRMHLESMTYVRKMRIIKYV